MSEIQIAHRKILESQRLRGTLEDCLTDRMSPIEMRKLVQSFFIDLDEAGIILNDIMIAETNKEDLYQKDNGGWYRNFEIVLRQQANKHFREMDNLSELGAMSFSTPQNERLDWEMINPNIFLKVMKRGFFTTITGPPGFGKTDFSLLLTQIAIANNIKIFTNIIINDPSGRVKTVSNISSFLKEVVNCYDEGIEIVFVLDEAGVIWSKKDAMTVRNKNLEKLARLLRKLHCGLIFIVQEKFGIPPLVDEFRGCSIHKYTKKQARIRFDNGLKVRLFLKSIPSTDIAFDTDDFGSFEFDIDMEKFWRYISKSDSSKRQRELILQYIKKNEDDNAPDIDELRKEIEDLKGDLNRKLKEQKRILQKEFREKLRLSVRKMKQYYPDITERKIADITGYSNGYIHQLLVS